jgi:O-antigen ligase
MNNLSFNIYLIFIISWFTHLAARVPALGAIRFDLCLILFLTLIIMFGTKDENKSIAIKTSKTHKIIKILLLYIVVTLPFVQWPGSVVRNGIENYVKAIVFYYFTIYLVDDERKLKRFILVFLGCQTFRILEPVYLHVTSGYWGSIASMGGWEFMNRLSGAPSDTVNPNGLAFIILTVIPFFLCLYNTSFINKILAVIILPISIYALILTASRSGMLALLILLFVFFLKSKNKIMIGLLIIIGIMISYSYMGANSRDRYISIFSSDTKNAATAEGRITGIKNNFIVALRRPLFGHGLGTSREANANFDNSDQPSHNLFTEAAEELGFVGLILFLLLIKSILDNYLDCMKEIKKHLIEDRFIISLNSATQVWLIMNIFFSFASYGLSSYEWYFFAGLSIALKTLVSITPEKEAFAI